MGARVFGRCTLPLTSSFIPLVSWRIALQWQDMPKEIALIACTDPARAITSFSHGLPRPLVVVKAWRGGVKFEAVLDRFKQWKIEGWAQWYQFSGVIKDFLKEEVDDETMALKGLAKNLVADGKVLWRPLEPSKAELLQKSEWPSFVKDARSMVLYLLSETGHPTKMPVLVAMAESIYERQTIYNTVNKLKREGLVSSGSWASEHYGDLRLTDNGQHAAYCLSTHGRAKGARSLLPRI